MDFCSFQMVNNKGADLNTRKCRLVCGSVGPMQQSCVFSIKAHIFFTEQIFALGSAVVKAQKV